MGILEIPYVINAYPDFDEKTGTSKEDMILEDLISTNLMQCGVCNVNYQKMCRCISELERIYGIKKGNNQNSLQDNLTSKIKQQIAQNIIEIGRRLIKVKESLPHGEWGKWLEEKVDFKQTMASKFMRVATEFSNFHTYENLTQSKIFALLDLPLEERTDFVAQAHKIKGQTKTEMDY